MNAGTTHFGFQDVGFEEKPHLVRSVFSSVARRYDVMNDLMSGGIHRLWKAELVDCLAPRPGRQHLDVAGGTGDVAFRIADRLAGLKETKILVCDYTPEMIAVGRNRALDRGFIGEIDWICGDAQALPFPARRWDSYTIAFGLRNVTDVDRALREAWRVLKPGGHFLCLEFSRVVPPVLDRLYDLYSFNVLPAMGQAVAGDEDAYRYLVESIRRFPAQEELKGLMEQAGFGNCSFRNLAGGIAAIHSGWRI
ncbi:MAG: class I SAM-dependent methyltransferase [Kiloniellales bacterium]|nr:class I SAM-dependent methyltransferase [Kiloniellales bacterium]